MPKCECEHLAHMDNDQKTPNGNFGHKYGQEFLVCINKHTIYGNFSVCEDCLRDCMQDQ